MGFQIASATLVGFERVNNNHYITPYEPVKRLSNHDSISTQLPTDHSNDARSHAAMEELASLMLTMDLEGQGEPSFTLPPGKSKVVFERDLPSKDDLLNRDSGFREAPTQTREHLMDGFMQKFNIFHQFLDESDAKSIVQQLPCDEVGDDRFRNYALFSVGAHLSDDPEISALSSEFARSAESMVLQCLRQDSSDLVVQGLALLAWRELMLGNDSMAYNYIGELLYIYCTL
jgi:hypothetical protein